MNSLPIADLTIIAVYLLAMVAVGFYFSRKNEHSDHYSKASGKIPGWAIGLSIYATFLSSNTFLGVPGKAFGGNWNAFMFSLSMPLAAWVASRFFVPFYRTVGEISAYTHLEKRFGGWARTYAVLCFLLTQFARMGSIFLGMSISLQALTGFSMASIMIVMGICIILYTVLGGMEAVIWTEVVQGIIKTLGALLILFLVVREVPGGVDTIVRIARDQHKASLGSTDFSFTSSTLWMVLFYGFFMNLNNFVIDQNYVQRYHTATNARQAAKSIWLCVYLYIPASLLFFVIGTALYAFYQVHADQLLPVQLQLAAEKAGAMARPEELQSIVAGLKPADYGDKVLPHFMVTHMPTGVTGLIVSAILAAAMSTISSSMNASATVFTVDIYKKYFRKNISEKGYMKALYVSTVLFGLAGLGSGLAMIGSKSILDKWWELSGLFAGGMLGLFLLGLVARTAQKAEGLTAVLIGLLVVIWMSFSSNLPDQYAFLKNPLHKNMVIVVGTLTIFLVGLILARFRRKALQ